MVERLNVTHLMFVDDLLLFGNGSTQEEKIYARIIDLFFLTSGMEINRVKSFIHLNIVLQFYLAMIKNLLSFFEKYFEVKLTYLGFHFKPNNYQIQG
jgi:hypothetical protein